MEANYLATPLVAVAGIPHPPTELVIPEHHALYSAQQLERVTVCEQNVPISPIVSAVASSLAQRSVNARNWDPQQLKRDRMHFRFQNFVDLLISTAKPSILSPKHEQNDSFVFSAAWIEKYQLVQPAVVLAFYEVPLSSSVAEEDLAAILNGLVDELAKSNGPQLMAVIVGDTASLARCLPLLKRETDLKAPEQLLGLPTDADLDKCPAICERIYEAIVEFSDQFFLAKSRAIRTKRQLVAPPLDLLTWDARYTLKLAFMLEFRGDGPGALRLYESAYDSLDLLFKNNAIAPNSPAFDNAKDTLDLVALKMLHHTLPLPIAYDKLQQHLNAGTQLRLSSGKTSAQLLRWQAEQCATFAQLLNTFSPTELALPGGMPVGLVWLDAAVLHARADGEFRGLANSANFANSKENLANSELSTERCFLTAISELSLHKRSKAYALTRYGDWLTQSARSNMSPDLSAATAAYRTAQRLLMPSSWPSAERYLGEQLNTELSLFALGESTKVPTETPSVCTPHDWLVLATGNWRSREAHVGRETRAQVVVHPKPIRGALMPDRMVIRHSHGEAEFVFDKTSNSSTKGQTETPPRVILARSAEATRVGADVFAKPNATFEFAVIPKQTGVLQLLSVTIWLGNFCQTVPIKRGTNQWTNCSGQTRHLELVLDPREVEITTRPAKLRLADQTPNMAGFNEMLNAQFELSSHEDEVVQAQVRVYLHHGGSEAPRLVSDSNLRLEPGLATAVDASFTAPVTLFELETRVQYTTTTDLLPISFEYRKEIDVMRPFRVTFDVMPMLGPDQAWPAVFDADTPVLAIPRQWRLVSTCLGTFTNEELVLHAAKLSVQSRDAEFVIKSGNDDALALAVPHNAVHRLSHAFVATHNDGVRTFAASAHVTLHWSRQKTQTVINEFELPAVRLTLPTQEPRVLAICDHNGGASGASVLTFHLENATGKLLNFSVQMSSSTYFAYQGPRIAHVTMLPYSTHALTYQLVPLGDANVQNRRPLPDLRVYDVNYKRLLPIAPGDLSVHFEQGALFI